MTTRTLALVVLSLAAGAEAVLCWFCSAYGKSGSEMNMNIPASIGFFWHFLGGLINIVLSPTSSTNSIFLFAVGVAQFFVIFWTGAMCFRAIRSRTKSSAR